MKKLMIPSVLTTGLFAFVTVAADAGLPIEPSLRDGNAPAIQPVQLADYTAYRDNSGSPKSIMLSYYAGPDTRGFVWQTATNVTSGTVWLRKGDYAASGDIVGQSGTLEIGATSYVHEQENCTLHNAHTGDLEDGLWSYCLGCGDKTACGQFTVRSAEGAFTAVNLNDIQTSVASKLSCWGNVVDATCATLPSGFDFVLFGGDYVDGFMDINVDGYVQWGVVTDTARPKFGDSPWIMACGNHESLAYMLGYDFKELVSEEFAHTSEPMHVGCHVFRQGGAAILTLPYYDNSDAAEIPESVKSWLRTQLAAAADDNWRIVMLHAGPYTTGDHAPSNAFIEQLAPIFAAGKVDLVLQAHDHTYSRTLPYRWSGAGYCPTTNETFEADVNLAPATTNVAELAGVPFYLDPEGTIYVAAGCAGHRVGEMSEYALDTGDSSFTHRDYRLVTDTVKVDSTYATAGSPGSRDVGMPMFAVLKVDGGLLTYDWYVAETNGCATLFDTLRICKADAVPSVPSVPYVDADGATRTKFAGEFTVVTAETRTLTNGWYAVVDDVVLPEGANLTVSGSAHLILCDGASLTVTNTGDHVAGICVVDANCLTIYGQEAGTGVLMAQGGEYCAGIGGFADGSGRDEPDCGTVTIIGGTVVATGGLGAAGIGCSPMGRGGHVAIHGGTVTATSGTGGTGIGCCEDILVPPKDGSEVVITGGKVSATGLRYDIHQKDIHFASLSISGGVFARRPEDGWCAEHFTVFANSDSATSGDYPYAVLPSRTVTVGDLPAHVAAAWTSGEGTVTNASAGASFAVPYEAENVRVIFTAEPGWEIVGNAEVYLGTVTDDITFGEGNDYRVPEARYLLGDIPYLDWDGTQMTNAALPKYVFTFVTDRTRELTNGWYAVTNDVVFPMGANLVVNGSAHLVLCDGASLTITNAVGAAAVAVPEEARLAIYGQEAGTGALVARGGVQCAGIGGGAPVSPMTSGWTPELIYGHCGTVAIHGGTVTAEGSNGGAGVGGGDGGNGGTVTVSGGTVTATGTDGGAGIGGGGMGGEGGTVTIYDGAVSASGGANLEGIGPGWGYIGDASKSGTVTIFGGIFAQAPRDAWLADDHAVIANQDVMTVAAYPWAVVPYPAAWPAADDAVKAKFGAWRNGAGAEAVLSTDDAQKAFLLNVPVTGIKELVIESIDVDADGNATIVVGAPGAFFFDRLDLGEINGILYVLAGDTLETMEPKSVAHWTPTNGKAITTVKAHFIRAAIGFKEPEGGDD